MTAVRSQTIHVPNSLSPVLNQSESHFSLAQDHFDAVMKEYPESSKAMDLIAEHRLRTLHASAAWQSKQSALESKVASLGSKIEHVLEVHGAPSRCCLQD